ncbi:MAG: pyridoxal phosphate-dependent aminotransferase [Litoreibacter sp.]
MRPSTRIATLNDSGSDGWDVFYRSRDMIDAGVAVTELTIGEHDIRTDASILAAMHHSATKGNTGYAMIPGIQALRIEIARRVQARTGVVTTAGNVIVTPGGQAALFAAHAAVCDPGDVACYLDPYYATYPGTLRAVGATPRAIKLSPDTAFQPAPSQLLKECAGARSLLVNSPNNPTGVIYTAGTMDGIAAAAREHDLWVISDEVYDTQIWEGEHISPRALSGMKDRTIVVGSMSKSHAMTGSRIGWIVASEEMIEHLLNLSNTTTYCVPGYIQDAALFALKEGPELEEKIAAPFRRRRALARKILAGQNQLGLVPSAGAMYLMLDVRQTGHDGESFVNALLDTHHIAVMPGESFGTAAAGHIRVAMTVEDATFENALKTIVTFAQSFT